MREGYYYAAGNTPDANQKPLGTPAPGTIIANAPVPFEVGNKVEWSNMQSYRRRVGVVVSVCPATQVLEIIDFQLGTKALVSWNRVTAVHGYLHIDTPEVQRF